MLSAKARAKKKAQALGPKKARPVLRSSYQFLNTQAKQNPSSILSRPCSHGVRVRMDRWLQELEWTSRLMGDLQMACDGVPAPDMPFEDQEVACCWNHYVVHYLPLCR